ncbi:CHAD domain-containing protein [Rhodococcus kronopolitis]|uniref:CHAD domain-containing protein n=1 Tax=Rhodococcus kronopolitis TaxID=1460226 RepID=A0ABV9FKG4_9NOCA
MGSRRKRADAERVVAVVRRHRERLDSLADAVRRDDEDAVHQMRVCTRQLRSLLGTFRDGFDRESVKPVRSELRWLGTVLGRPRDEEVLAARFLSLLDAQPPELVRGPVRHRLVTVHAAGYSAARRDAVAALDGDRYRRLLADLDDLLARPRPPGDLSVAQSLHGAVRRVRETGRRAGLRGPARDDDDAPPELLHTARKRAKALRYATEAADGRRRAAVAQAAKKLQTTLGEHQDAVVARRQLLTAADLARAAGEDTFTYGLLVAAESARADSARRDAHGRLRTLRKRARKL